MRPAGDREAFLKAICAAPDDDTPRLVYADWLDDRGDRPDDAARAEFIRVQVRLAHLRHDNGDETHDINKLLRREWQLFAALAANQLEWMGKVVHDICVAGSKWASHLRWFRRGFVEEVTCEAQDWLACGDKLVWQPEKKEYCRRCQGSAVKTVWDLEKSTRVAPHKTKTITCPECQGTGKVAKPFPPAAQPIRRVNLTGIVGEFDELTIGRLPGDHTSSYRVAGEVINVDRHKMLILLPRSDLLPLLLFARRWPDVAFASDELRGRVEVLTRADAPGGPGTMVETWGDELRERGPEPGGPVAAGTPVYYGSPTHETVAGLYVNTGTQANPVWQRIGAAGAAHLPAPQPPIPPVSPSPPPGESEG